MYVYTCTPRVMILKINSNTCSVVCTTHTCGTGVPVHICFVQVYSCAGDHRCTQTTCYQGTKSTGCTRVRGTHTYCTHTHTGYLYLLASRKLID